MAISPEMPDLLECPGNGLRTLLRQAFVGLRAARGVGEADQPNCWSIDLLDHLADGGDLEPTQPRKLGTARLELHDWAIGSRRGSHSGTRPALIETILVGLRQMQACRRPAAQRAVPVRGGTISLP